MGRKEEAAVTIRTHRPGDIGWIVSRHGAVYADQYGWDERFESLVARISADFIDYYDPKTDRCWIAEKDGERVGSIMLVRDREDSDTAKLRLLLVEPNARGLGLGRRLIQQCIDFSKETGYKRIVLWTQSILESARRLYRAAGFHLVVEEEHQSFGANLTGENWQLDLDET
jgi:GNAT superfamily N-acetyltransferase